MVGLSFAVFIVLSIVYAIYSYQFTNEVHEAIETEWEGVHQAYLGDGVDGVNEFISQYWPLIFICWLIRTAMY
jgi:uncharacterized membrane protein YukC